MKRIVIKIFGHDRLKCFKYDISIACDGTTAIEEACTLFLTENRHFDFVLLDNYMVMKHGPETAREMRELPDFDGMIIGITGNYMKDQLEHFISSGASTVLVKPVDINVLEKIVLDRLVKSNE
jgi:CheY-like chemotaxis protein